MTTVTDNQLDQEAVEDLIAEANIDLYWSDEFLVEEVTPEGLLIRRWDEFDAFCRIEPVVGEPLRWREPVTGLEDVQTTRLCTAVHELQCGMEA